jgi:hypothetical protein
MSPFAFLTDPGKASKGNSNVIRDGHPGRCFPIILARGLKRAPREPDGASPRDASRLFRNQISQGAPQPRPGTPSPPWFAAAYVALPSMTNGARYCTGQGRCGQECPPLESDRGREAAVGGLSPSETFPPDAFFSADCDLLLNEPF